MFLLRSLLLIASCYSACCSTTPSKGIVLLDSLTFDKVLSKFNVSIIKFDTSFPFGLHHEEYVTFGSSFQFVEDLLIGEVHIKDYGDKDNNDLAVRFGLKKEDFPVVKLFVRGQSKPYTLNDKQFNQTMLRNFLLEHCKSILYIGLPGTLENFDKLATRFVKQKTVDKRKHILLQAEKLWDQVHQKQSRSSAEIYVKYMRKALENSDELYNSETLRINNLLNGSLSKEKKSEMGIRLNILEAFKVPVNNEHKEL